MHTHLRREPSPVACGVTGPVKVTRRLSEVNCEPCVDSDETRRADVNVPIGKAAR